MSNTLQVEAMMDGFKEYIAELRENAGPPGKEPFCKHCRDLHWSDVVVTHDGIKITDPDLAWEIRTLEPEKVARSYVVECVPCKKRYVQDVVHERGQYRDGVYVDQKLIAQYWSKRKKKEDFSDPLLLAKNVPTGSVLIYGETGRYKTLVLQYWYNRKLNDAAGDPTQMNWLHENQLVQMFQNDAGFGLIDELKARKVRHFFLDELLYPVNWRSREKQGHFSDMVQRGFMNFFDYACNAKGSFNVYATSNFKPEDVLKEPESEPLLRRIIETFSAGSGKVKV